MTELDDLRALTLIRPMSAAIVHGSKRIENRPMNLPRAMRGVETVVAVHAGKKWDDLYERIVGMIDGQRTRIHALPKLWYGDRLHDEGIVGLMLLSGRVFTHEMVDEPCSPQRDNNDHNYVARHRLDGVLCLHPGKWYSGPFGYEIKHAVALDAPIAYRGMQGFWPVDGTIARCLDMRFAHERLRDEAASK